jgi:hypothetical protein
MAGLVPAIHALAATEDVDARHKAGHHVERLSSKTKSPGFRRGLSFRTVREITPPR